MEAGPAVTGRQRRRPRVTACSRRRAGSGSCSAAPTSAGCWRRGCSPSSATASSRRRSRARCCSTRSGPPTRPTSPRASPSCCCRTRWSGRSPACGWTGGAAGRCSLVANLVRSVLVLAVAALIAGGVAGVPFYVTGLLVFAVNRFLLAALSAGLPHTIEQRWLVSANAFSTTAGTAASVVGGGVAVGIAALAGSGDAAYAVVAAAAAAALRRRGRWRPAASPAGTSGPDAALGAERLSAGDVRARHGRRRPVRVRRSRRRRPRSAAIAVHRVCFGFLTLMTLLLYRNTYEAWGPLLPTGLAGVGQVLTAGAAGALLAAAVTPRVVRRIGMPRWIDPAARRRRRRAGGAGGALPAADRRRRRLRARLRRAGREDLRGHHAAGDGRRRPPRPCLLRLRHAGQHHLRRRGRGGRVPAAAVRRLATASSSASAPPTSSPPSPTRSGAEAIRRRTPTISSGQATRRR